MASDLSAKDRAFFEAILEKAEPYPEDDPIWEVWDGELSGDRTGGR